MARFLGRPKLVWGGNNGAESTEIFAADAAVISCTVDNVSVAGGSRLDSAAASLGSGNGEDTDDWPIDAMWGTGGKGGVARGRGGGATTTSPLVTAAGW